MAAQLPTMKCRHCGNDLPYSEIPAQSAFAKDGKYTTGPKQGQTKWRSTCKKCAKDVAAKKNISSRVESMLPVPTEEKRAEPSLVQTDQSMLVKILLDRLEQKEHEIIALKQEIKRLSGKQDDKHT